MTTDPPAQEQWPILSVASRRVLGVLVEKAKTTPDAYPLSVNAIVVGSNQKSNRDPVMNLDDDDVELTLAELQKAGLTTRITGGRVDRWRHNLYDVWRVSKVELAILAELLLRGPQTEGELRGRASRMEPLDDLDQLRAVLAPLVERKLVVYLGPEGRRGTQLTHGFHDAREIEGLRSRGPVEEPAAPRAASPLPSDLRDEVASLRAEVAALQQALTDVQQQLAALKSSLGA